MSRLEETALIFEGGGMRASGTAPVVVTLIEQGLQFPHVSGISAGSSHTANYLAGEAKRAEECFVDFADDPNFGSLGTFLRGEGLFNAHYIYEETGNEGQALPYNYDAFRNNTAAARIGAFRVSDGREVYWSKDDIADKPDLMRKVRASSTMPGLMPPVEIDEELYVDGALGPSGGIPLDAAMADGYERFFVVLTRPRGYRKRPPRNPQFYRRYFHQYPRVADALMTRWRNYNRSRDKLLELERRGQAYLYFPEAMSVTNHERNVEKLRANYDAGWEQAQRQLPEWLDWLA